MRAAAAVRSRSRHDELIATLQADTYAEDLWPPPESITWSSDLLRRWFEAGGALTMESVLCEPPGAREARVDDIGADFPMRFLRPIERVGGALAAAKCGDEGFFAELAAGIGRDGFAVTRLLGAGPDASVWADICAEGAALLPHMGPGATQGTNGVSYGRSTSGAPRGDRFMFVSEATRTHGCPTLASLDAALTRVGFALADAVEQERRLGYTILRRNDGLFACFPGGEGSPGYGAHLDGDSHTCRLSMIAYFNPGWQAERDGGELCMLDEASRCWRAVAPESDTLVVFRSRDVLHKVAPTLRRRFALTAFWSIGNDSNRER